MTIFICHDNCYTFNRFFKDCGRPLRKEMRFIFYADLPYRKTLPNDIALFTDLERLNETQVELAIAAQQQLSTAGAHILNAPSQVLRRYDLLRTLHQKGINPFRAYRLNEDRTQLRFPVFLRLEREHQGNLSPLLHNLQEIEAAVTQALQSGISADNLLLAEYCDVRDADGLYRKYSSFQIGDHCIPRHLMASSSWMSKSATHDQQDDPECVRQENDFLVNAPHEKAIRSIFDLAGINYGRIDYSLQNDQIRVWEINTNPNIIPENCVSPLRQAGQDQVHQRVYKALEELTSPSPSKQIPFHISPQLKQKLQINTLNCILHPLRRQLRPIRPERVKRFVKNKVLKLK